MKIVLIGNYTKDRQKSMQKFFDMLACGLEERGHEVIILRPDPIFGRLCQSTSSTIGKWCAYIDKYLIFPLKLGLISRFRFKKSVSGREFPVFHVTDHSNAMYLPWIFCGARIITCHDLLAIRGALGDKDAWCSSGISGKLLQKWILASLKAADHIACVSTTTHEDLKRFLPDLEESKTSVIYNAFNADFHAMHSAEAKRILVPSILPDIDSPFILHVGSSLPRKNRIFLAKSLELLGDRWAGRVVYSGAPLSPSERNFVDSSKCSERILSAINPDHIQLLSLYSVAHALVFPSWSEGFGWPVIEAQACECPVICSNRTALLEVAGDAAILLDPTDEDACASAILKLTTESTRRHLIEKGLENTKRFDLEKLICRYELAYKNILISHESNDHTN